MIVTYEEFHNTLTDDAPPEDVVDVLKSLWHEKNGDWDLAHRIVQSIPSEIGSAVHAYLHRKEGDIGNARYWYGRAGRSQFSGSLDDEWLALAEEITSE